jgi:hypothetical protein
MASKDRPWFHEHGNADALFDKYSKIGQMSQTELFNYVKENHGGDFAAFKKNYNQVVNSHWRYGSGSGRKRDGENPFDARPDLKLDTAAIEQEWNYQKGADLMLSPIESVLGQTPQDFIENKVPINQRYNSVMEKLVGAETLNVNKGGFKPVEEFEFSKTDPDTGEVTKTKPIESYKNTLKEKASGVKKIDTGGGARAMLASMARRGVKGVSSSSAAQSSFKQMAARSSAKNNKQQIINNVKHKDEARANLTKLTSDLIKYNVERKQDLQATLGETVTGMANLAAANAGYEELRTLNNQPFSHFSRKKD